MQREFSINLLFLVGINLVVKPFFIFGIDRTVQNVVGTEVYGLYFSLLSLTYLLQILSDFGIQNFNSREISQHNHLLTKYFSNIIVLKFLLGAIFFIAIFAVAGLLGYGREHFYLLSILALNQFLAMLILYLRSNVSGLAMYRTDSFLSALDKLLMIVFCSVLLWTPVLGSHFTIEWFAIAQTFSLLLTALASIFILNPYLTSARLRFQPATLAVIFRKSFPFALVILLMTLYTRIDAVMLERMLPDGEYQAGVYGAAYRLLDAVNMFGFLFASLLLPMFSRMLKKGEPTGGLVNHSFQLIWAGAIALAAATFFFKQEIMVLLYHHAEGAWGDVLGWLMFSFVAMAGTYIFGTLLTANGSLMKMNRIFTAAIILNIALNWALIPVWKAEGAAISTFVTQWFAFVMQVILAKNLLDFSITWRMTVRMSGYAAACFFIGYIVSKVGFVTWLPGFLLTLAASAVAAFVLKMVNYQALREIIKRK